MNRKVVRSQVDRILSTGAGDTRSVIIQLAPTEDLTTLGRAAGRAISGRALALSARDCLPTRRQVPDDTTATPPSAPADPSASVGSFSTQTPNDGDAATFDTDLRERALSRISRTLEQIGAKPGHEDVVGPLWAADAASLELPVATLQRLPEDGGEISGIYPNQRVRLPPMVRAEVLPPQVLENRASSWGLERTGALAAWGAYGARGAGVTVGVLDTGVDPSHPDLAGKISAFAEFDSTGKLTGTEPHDPVGHGTHVCGTIAGGNASGQWIGVAPDARLAVAKVLDDKGGHDAQILAGITWAIEQKVDVINLSVSGLVLEPEAPPTYTVALLMALRHGIPVVVSIGNEGSETTGLPGNDLYAMSVGAIDHLDQPAGFSGGRTQIIERADFIDPQLLPMPYFKPEVCAPGVAIVSSVPGGTWAPLNGTSMASPHVAGVIALMLSATTVQTAVSPPQRGFLIMDLIAGSVDELGESGQDHRYGFGEVNALRTIGFARERGF
jgi:subtilisin family serine protease